MFTKKGCQMYLDKNGLGCSVVTESVRDKQILRMIVIEASRRKISFGAVGLLVYPWLLERMDEKLAKNDGEREEFRQINEYRAKTLRDNAEMIPYVWFPHLNPDSIGKFLFSVNIDISAIRID